MKPNENYLIDACLRVDAAESNSIMVTQLQGGPLNATLSKSPRGSWAPWASPDRYLKNPVQSGFHSVISNPTSPPAKPTQGLTYTPTYQHTYQRTKCLSLGLPGFPTTRQSKFTPQSLPVVLSFPSNPILLELQISAQN
ncbi:uncharacterized protein DFL_004940 [Arthrobotrys flagrans]|uniref:Uncharacterized protein n=1 Tax=Arthrobotrys flagrans TaxID=97331 RepID=A0A437A6K1_ARTFL|nr:hypothetical protein DFL_004940 [Arthrobotrys flagrans]